MQNSIFGERLRQIRKEKRMSQADLGKKIGKDTSTINRWENGERIPPRKTVAEVADVLEVDEEWLLGLTEQPPEKKCWANKMKDTIISPEELYRARGECVWLAEKGSWALVADNEDVLYLPDGSKIPFREADGSIRRNPSPLCYGIDSMMKPLSRSRLLKCSHIWAEEIGPNPYEKRRGWYRLSEDKSCYIGEYGDILQISDYGVKWVGFKDICD